MNNTVNERWRFYRCGAYTQRVAEQRASRREVFVVCCEQGSPGLTYGNPRAKPHQQDHACRWIDGLSLPGPSCPQCAGGIAHGKGIDRRHVPFLLSGEFRPRLRTREYRLGIVHHTGIAALCLDKCSEARKRGTIAQQIGKFGARFLNCAAPPRHRQQLTAQGEA
jgi:hypothetical protein